MRNPSWWEDPPEDPPEEECMCGRGDACDCDGTDEKARGDLIDAERDLNWDTPTQAPFRDRDCDYWQRLFKKGENHE